jgi:hypothetical protein
MIFPKPLPGTGMDILHDKTESQGGKKNSVLIICIDKIPNLCQIGKLLTVHKRTHMIFMNCICNLCSFSKKLFYFTKWLCTVHIKS